MRRDLKNSRGDEGFSLVELLVVLTIMALLTGIVATTVIDYLAGARVNTAKTQMKTFASSLKLYKLDVGQYPVEKDGLLSLIENAGNQKRWNGPYIDAKKIPLDPWDHPYQYKLTNGGRSFDLISLGADNAIGGEDDAADIALE